LHTLFDLSTTRCRPKVLGLILTSFLTWAEQKIIGRR